MTPPPTSPLRQCLRHFSLRFGDDIVPSPSSGPWSCSGGSSLRRRRSGLCRPASSPPSPFPAPPRPALPLCDLWLDQYLATASTPSSLPPSPHALGLLSPRASFPFTLILWFWWVFFFFLVSQFPRLGPEGALSEGLLSAFRSVPGFSGGGGCGGVKRRGRDLRMPGASPRRPLPNTRTALRMCVCLRWLSKLETNCDPFVCV